MTVDEISLKWGPRFGLAVSPLFERGEVADPTSHSVFLDGGHGTFALSHGSNQDPLERAAWAWSSDIAHHVSVTSSSVKIIRWDAPTDVTSIERASVEANLDDFYNFLAADQVSTNRTVVTRLLSFFRKIRSLAASARVPDARSCDIFLRCLGQLIHNDELPEQLGIAEDAEELCGQLNPGGLSAAIEEVKSSAGVLGGLRLHPALAIRHAGGPLFQEAHFELIRAPSVDFFGYVGAPEVNEVGRGGAHFTPPPLARSLAENAMASLGDLSIRRSLSYAIRHAGRGCFFMRRLGRFEGPVSLVN